MWPKAGQGRREQFLPIKMVEVATLFSPNSPSDTPAFLNGVPGALMV
jgi:hypothetical protein